MKVTVHMSNGRATLMGAALSLALLAGAPLCRAQEQRSTLPTTFSGRASAAVDWKIIRGLHLSAEYEIRSKDAFAGVERHQAGAGLSYKFNDCFRAGVGYDYIGHYNGEGILKPRHRAYVDMIGTLRMGYWRLSLRERVQLSHKSYEVNQYQEPLNGVGLKSRLKLSYRGHQTLAPYTYVELRNSFNDASYSADYVELSGRYTNYSFDGYHAAILDRVRLSAGLEWEFGRFSALDFSFLADYNRERKLDVNREGTKLKSVTWENGWGFALTVGYVFSF